MSPAYLGLFATELSTGSTEVTGLIYALVTPSLVVGGVVLLLEPPWRMGGKTC